MLGPFGSRLRGPLRKTSPGSLRYHARFRPGVASGSLGAPRVAALLDVNEPRRADGDVAARRRCSRAAGPRRTASACCPSRERGSRPSRRRRRRSRTGPPGAAAFEAASMFAASAYSMRWRGRDTVAQEHVGGACGVPVELEVPREHVARIDLLERHLEDRLRGMSHVGLEVRTARLLARGERRVLVPVGPRDEQGAAPQGQIRFDRFVGRLEVVLGVRRREAQRPLRLRIEDSRFPSRGAWGRRDR